MSISSPRASELQAFQNLHTFSDVASFFDTTEARLNFLLYSKKSPSYKVFYLKKSSGGYRKIESPPKIIRGYQKQLLRCINHIFKPKKPVHGFCPNKSIVSNAKVHLGSQIVLNFDLKDFFPSIHFGRVRGVFGNRPFNFTLEVARTLAQICCHHAKLAQGSPTSPILGNLVCRGLDRDMERLCKKKGCTYTRYADDITISSKKLKFPSEIFLPEFTETEENTCLGDEIQSIVKKHDFKINHKKTRCVDKNKRLEVTGIKINEKPNVSRKYIRHIRAILYNWEKTNEQLVNEQLNRVYKKQRLNGTPSIRTYLHGKLKYLAMVRGHDDPIYTRHAIRFHSIAQIPKAIPVYGRSSYYGNLIQECVWIVVGKDINGNEVKQGTAFYLCGIGFVSVAHVFNEKSETGFPVHSWELLSSTKPHISIPIKSFKKNDHVDIAILQTDDVSYSGLTVYNDSFNINDNIRLLGFPRWKSRADQMQNYNCKLTQIRTISAVRYILTGALIYEGNSGGPILNEEGRVIGIVNSSYTQPITPNAGTDIAHLHDI